MPQAEGMANDEKNPLFSERVREQLLLQRILVLDGVLDDDNGTLLATQLLTLAVEDPAADIALWINSPGGSVPSMLAIRDLMRLVPCDVATLARDTRRFAESGYAIQSISGFDLFPNTPHVETVVVMKRSGFSRTDSITRRF